MKVVIVGGGFGGVRTALTLANKRDLEVKLITSQSYFEYHAALYRSATGRSPLEVAIPLRDFFTYAQNIEVVEDTITEIDPQVKVVTGQSKSRYTYDKLVLAPGNITEFYGVKGLKEYAYGVKTIHEALRLKRHLHEQLLAAKSERSYVVIGAGATGVELSAELVVYLKKIRKKHKVPQAFTVELIEAGSRVLANMPEEFSRVVEKRLKKLGVTTHYNTHVKSESMDSIQLSEGVLSSHTAIWAAGVANNPLFKKFPDIFHTDNAGRVVVDEYLQAQNDITVLGDSAATPYTGMAQTALYDARFVANNLLRASRGSPLQRYQPKQPIYAIPVGPYWAAVLWRKFLIYGQIGWMIRRLADLRLYLTFLPPRKALTTWKYGFINEEVCPICKQ